MFDRAEDQLAALLKGTIDQLDIPPDLYRAAVTQYQRVAQYLGAGDEFRVVMDYPWDEPGHTVGEDIQRVASIRKNKGNLPSAAWLPRHFSTQEERLLREMAAAAWLVADGDGSELLGIEIMEKILHPVIIPDFPLGFALMTDALFEIILMRMRRQ